MKTYFEETLKFIESEEMRDYLRTRADWLCSGERSRIICSEIVSRAPATLERKIPVLELIAEQTEDNPEWDYQNPAKLAKAARTALAERYDTIPPGTVFLLRDWHYSEPAHHEYELFTDFDAAARDIAEYEGVLEESPHNDRSMASYTIEKYIPGEDGKMAEYCQWILNSSGEIWYFDYEHDFKPEDWKKLYDYIGDLRLPLPFQPGDIILADCRPFAREKRVLFMGCDGDEDDCCAAQCLFILPNGRISIGAFNHNAFLSPLDDENSHVSGHYRAALYDGELSEHEAPLAVIGTALKSNPALFKDIHTYIIKHDIESHKSGLECRGAEWEQLKNAFGL